MATSANGAGGMDDEDDGSGAVIEHRWLGYDSASRSRFLARCSCGWRSNPFSTAGLAASAWDAHALKEARPDE
jgi:hypothetical protein